MLESCQRGIADTLVAKYYGHVIENLPPNDRKMVYGRYVGLCEWFRQHVGRRNVSRPADSGPD